MKEEEEEEVEEVEEEGTSRPSNSLGTSFEVALAIRA